MLDCSKFHRILADHGVSFFAGVPDSLLKDLNACIAERAGPGRHVVAANEGAAVALAAGWHVATGEVGAVYLQNSGLGNTVNPLTSLVDPEVYAIPVLLIVGWRSEPGAHDEPQHKAMGRIQPAFLDALGVPHEVLPGDLEGAEAAVRRAIETMTRRSGPYALVVRKDTFEPYRGPSLLDDLPVSRERAIEIVTSALGARDVVVSTTGKASRELFEIRERRGEGHAKDFLTVGSMGHASQIALGIALARPERSVWCLDGDGSVLMHMGSLAVVGQAAPPNLRHVVLNNGAHESVGGQPTAAFHADLAEVARASGYRLVLRASAEPEISEAVARLAASPGPSFLEIRVNLRSRKDLGRPTTTPIENRAAFEEYVRR